MAQKSAEAIESVEHIPSAEHGRGFPPFDSTTFASQLLWLALTFIALYLLMSRLALPRIGAILETRRQRVEGDLAEAQRLKDQSDAAIAAHEKALAEARGRAQALAISPVLYAYGISRVISSSSTRCCSARRSATTGCL